MVRYDIGDARRLQATFKDITGTNTDPTTVTFSIKEPNSTAVDYIFGTDAEVVKSTSGVYYIDWICTKFGEHLFRWEGTGTVTAAEEGSFTVKKRSF